MRGLGIAFAALAGAAAAGLAGCASAPLHEQEWLEARTPSFVIWSAQDREATVELARQLEAFRSFVGLILRFREQPSPVPTYVFVLSGRAEQLGLDRRRAGQFLQTLRANYALLRPARGVPTTEVLFHEYTHFLMRNHSSRLYPLWYSEGMAELLGTVKIEGREFEYGGAPTHAIEWLANEPWMDFGELLAHRGGDRSPRFTSRFYTQSWLLTHWISFGRDGDAGQAMQRYLDAVEAGLSERRAFERSFGVRPEVLRGQLREYLYRDSEWKRGRFSEQLAADAVELRPLHEAEVALHLASVQEAFDPALAEPLYRRALALAPDLARAHAGIATSAAHRGDWQATRHHIERALELAPADATVLLDAATFEIGVAIANAGSPVALEARKRARRLLVRASQAGGHTPEVLALYGATFLLAGEDAARGLEALEEAHAQLGANAHVKLLLARAYAATGQIERALPLRCAVEAWTHAAVHWPLLEHLQGGEVERRPCHARAQASAARRSAVAE